MSHQDYGSHSMNNYHLTYHCYNSIIMVSTYYCYYYHVLWVLTLSYACGFIFKHSIITPNVNIIEYGM